VAFSICPIAWLICAVSASWSRDAVVIWATSSAVRPMSGSSAESMAPASFAIATVSLEGTPMQRQLQRVTIREQGGRDGQVAAGHSG